MGAYGNDNSGFSTSEREAMKARAKELAAEKRANKKKTDGEAQVREAITEMAGSDKVMAERIHELVTQTAPDLWPRTWYGMQAYAKDGRVICFFQAAGKFGSRWAPRPGVRWRSVRCDRCTWHTSMVSTPVSPVH